MNVSAPLDRAVEAYQLAEQACLERLAEAGYLCAPSIVVECGLVAALPHLLPPRTATPKAGILFRWTSCWIGVHWSRHNRRLCINLVPCVTIWIVATGGVTP